MTHLKKRFLLQTFFIKQVVFIFVLFLSCSRLAPSPCKTKKQDVCLIVDESLSVKVPNYVRMKTFLTQFIYQFDPDTHFSIITFAGKANVRCKFSDKRCQTADGTYDLISEIPDKLFFGTYTDKALIAANQIVFTPENGDRADAKNVVIVITDGKTMKGAAPFSVTVPPLRVCLTTREI